MPVRSCIVMSAKTIQRQPTTYRPHPPRKGDVTINERMRQCRKLLAALTVLALSGPPVQQTAERLRFSGFGTLGVVHSNDKG